MLSYASSTVNNSITHYYIVKHIYSNVVFRRIFLFILSSRMLSFTSFRQMLPSILFGHLSPSFILRRTLSSALEAVQDIGLDVPNIEVRICSTHEELDKCVSLHQRVWQFNDLDTIPRRVFIVTSSVGGVVLGAYESRIAKSPLLGFVWALPGISRETNGQAYIHAEMMAVHPSARKHRIGQRLMLAVSQYALSQNINIMKGHFDPTDSKLAYLYINRCHAIAKRYTIDYYGRSSSPLHKLSTDRLHVEWRLDLLNLKREDQFFPQRDLLTSDSDQIEEVHIPPQMAQWKNSGDVRAAKTQQAIYNKLTTAFERGLVVLRFRLDQDGTGVYQLGYSTLTKQIINK